MIKDNDKDIYMTEDGDLYLSRSNEDIHLATKYKNEIIESIIRRRIMSNDNDWRVNSVIASNIDIFKGMPRQNEIIAELKKALFTTITENFLVDPSNLQINVLGLKENIIGIGIVIDGKDQSVDDTITFKIMYDFRENKFTPLDVLGVFN